MPKQCLTIALLISACVSCNLFNPSKNDLYPLEGNIIFKFEESYQTWDKKEKSICIKNKTQSFTSPEYKLYWRYPKNSFAYLCGTMVQDSCICDAFIDSLKQIIKIEPFSFQIFSTSFNLISGWR